MSVNLSPVAGAAWQFFDANGKPLNGGLINTYAAGTTTPQSTFTTSSGSIANANPIVLDASGRTTTETWLTSGIAYKFVLTDSLLNLIGTYDNLTGINDVSFTLSEWVATNLTPTFVSGTQFTVPGNQTSIFTNGRQIQSTNTSGTVYSTIVSSAFTTLTTVTVSPVSAALDSGLSVVNYALLSSSNPSIPSNIYNLTSVTGTNTITALCVSAPILSGQALEFIPAATNTGPVTLNVNSDGAKNVFQSGVALVSGELQINVPSRIKFDGTQYNIIGPFNGGKFAAVFNATNTNTHTIAGPLDLSNAAAGQIVFPSTRNPSSNANTLDGYAESSFTVTLTGVNGTVTGTATATEIGNLAVLIFPTLAGTSTATTKTLTGLPSALASGRTINFFGDGFDNSGGTNAMMSHSLSGTTITLNKDLNGGAWTASGTTSVNFIPVSYTFA